LIKFDTILTLQLSGLHSNKQCERHAWN